jgi:nucleoid-associated protein YgaU
MMMAFEFFKDAGEEVLGNGNDDEAIKQEIESRLGEEAIDGLFVTVEDGKVSIAGVAQDNATKEKAILIAGNIAGVESVDADQLVTAEVIDEDEMEEVVDSLVEDAQVEAEAQAEEGVESDEVATKAQENQTSEPRFYTIQEGDTLWKIAQEFYGDGNKYRYIVEQNLEVIKDEDRIYPGQAIRIPDIA